MVLTSSLGVGDRRICKSVPGGVLPRVSLVRLDRDVTGCRWRGLISDVAGGVVGSVAQSVAGTGIAGGCRRGCLWGPDRGCVSLEGVVERKVRIKKIKQSAEKWTYLSIMFWVASALCYCFFNLRYGLTSGPCLRAPSK